ncbi:MAG: DsbA family protein [bacterium]
MKKTLLITIVFVLMLTFVSCATKKVEEKEETKGAETENTIAKDDETYKVEVGSSIFKGPEDAPVTVINFSDFQCPFSKKSVELMSKMMKNYDGKIKYVFKHFPLGFHKFAKPAALASIAAQKQGKFWEYYAKLFDELKNINEENLVKWASELNLDMEQFEKDRNSEKAGKILQDDISQGMNFGVRGTPTLFINGKRIVGANNTKIEELIISQIAEGEKLKAKGMKDVYSEIVKNGESRYIPPKREPAKVPSDIYKIEIPEHSPIWGLDDADVTIVLFDDFECPFCSRLHAVYEQIKKEYEGKIKIAFINLPLRFHKKATPAALAALAAHKQEKFWEMYDSLFKKQKEWNAAPDLPRWLEDEARLLELDTDKFLKDFQSAQLAKIIKDDLALANKLSIRGTPASFINGRFVNGALPFETFKQVIDEELEKVKPLREKGLKGSELYYELIKDGKEGISRVAKEKDDENEKVYEISLTGKEPVKGKKNAQITIVEFSEFQCPFCRRGAATVEEIVKDYKGKVKLVFKHMPLAFHKEARPAAKFSIAVKSVYGDEKFFAIGEMLFDRQSDWKVDSMKKFKSYTKELKMDWEKIKKEMESEKTDLLLKQDMEEGSKHGVKGVPAFFINGKMISGAKKKEYFKSVIDSLLKKEEKK